MTFALDEVVDRLLAPLPRSHGAQVVDFQGPRRWWSGPLDVEGLSLGSVTAAVEAVAALGNVPGRWRLRPTRIAASFASLTTLSIDGVRPEGFAELSGFYRTSDGWVRVHANYPHHRQRLEHALATTGRPGVDRALRSLTAVEAEQVIRGAGGVAAAVRTRDVWRSGTQAQVNRSMPWIALRPATPASSARGRWTPQPGADRPLDGLRVLDLTRVVAGPTATRFMAALGADVLRIDPPHLPELDDHHADTGFGKRSAVADLRVGAVAEQVHRLLEDADVVFLGYRRDSLAGVGLTPEHLELRHPHLVVVSLDAWGNPGPLQHEVGFDSIVQAAVGIADGYRDEQGRPGALPVQALDHATGYGMVAAVATLLARRTRGEGSGSASLSLARTADQLYALGQCGGPVERLRPAVTDTVASAYGQLQFVPPPVDLPSGPLTYPSPPSRYGSDSLTWLVERDKPVPSV